MGVDATLARFARHQLGLITLPQALAAGLSWSGIRTRRGRGEWLLVRRSVYAIAGVQPSPAQAALAVCLAAGEGCWASHRTAAALWDLAVPPPERIEVVTLSEKRIRLQGVVNHRSSWLPLQDLVQHRLVPMTSVARTLVDCVSHLPGRHLARAVDDALRRHLLTVAELTACAARLDHGGGRHLLPLRAVLADRQGSYHPGGSQRELDVASILVAGGLRPPVPQYRVVVGGRECFIDYAYPEALVGLEFDGFADHGLIRSTFDDDRQRGNVLTVAGWLMLHFTSNSPPAHIVGSTRQALDLRAPERAS